MATNGATEKRKAPRLCPIALRYYEILPSNSTVNGRRAVRKHDAREHLDGWQNLAFNDSRVYPDGHPLVGHGRYLHVPLADDPDERWYRVRCQWHLSDYLPADEWTGCHVITWIEPVIHKGRWHWAVQIAEAL